MPKSNLEQGVDAVIMCASKNGKISVPGVEQAAIRYARDKGLDILEACKIAVEAVKRSCLTKEARCFGYSV